MAELKLDDAEIVEGFRAIRVGLERLLEEADRFAGSSEDEERGSIKRKRSPRGATTTAPSGRASRTLRTIPGISEPSA